MRLSGRDPEEPGEPGEPEEPEEPGETAGQVKMTQAQLVPKYKRNYRQDQATGRFPDKKGKELKNEQDKLFKELRMPFMETLRRKLRQMEGLKGNNKD